VQGVIVEIEHDLEEGETAAHAGEELFDIEFAELDYLDPAIVQQVRLIVRSFKEELDSGERILLALLITCLSLSAVIYLFLFRAIVQLLRQQIDVVFETLLLLPPELLMQLDTQATL